VNVGKFSSTNERHWRRTSSNHPVFQKQVKYLKIVEPIILKHIIEQIRTLLSSKKTLFDNLSQYKVIAYLFLENQIESIWKIKVNQNESLRFVRFESESK